MKNILITGGTGFIGSNLAIKLKKLNNNVLVFDNFYRNNYSVNNLKKNNIKVIKGDIRNFKNVNKVMKNIDTCFHLAAINGTKNFYKLPKDVLDVGIRGQLNVLDAILTQNVKKFIFFSSSEVYQNASKIPTNENINLNFPNVHNPRYSYGGSKFISEILTLNYLNNKTHKMIIRPHNIYGPKMGYDHVIPELILKILKKSKNLKNKSAEINILGSGKETRAFCYIDDAIDGIITCYKKGKNNNIYNIGNSSEISIIQLIELISKILNIKIKVIKNKVSKGSCMRRCPSINKIKKLGFKNNFDLKDGLILTISDYLDYYGLK